MLFIEQALAQDTNECIVWPFAKTKDGYGTTAACGKGTTAHRVVAILAHGQPTSARPHAAHLCHNRACINRRHIVWASRQENCQHSVADGRFGRGTQIGSAKLTEAEVLQIRALSKNMKQSQLARQFGVNQTAIGKILRGERWGWLEQNTQQVGSPANIE
jgi:hypothetical protein